MIDWSQAINSVCRLATFKQLFYFMRFSKRLNAPQLQMFSKSKLQTLARSSQNIQTRHSLTVNIKTVLA